VELTRICALLARAGIETDHLNAAAAANGGSATDVFDHGVGVLRSLEPKLTERQRSMLFTPDERQLASDLRWLETSGASVLAFGSPGFPALLARIRRAPAALYVLGDPAVLHEPQLAMVGARKATPAGIRNAHDFAQEFARLGLTVTSGLALGIDGASHEGALDGGGPTVAVCGNGLDIVYPREHRALAARIRERGALVSEFAPGTEPLPDHFPRRNRILSGLAHGTLVVEAGLRSGSLDTANHAVDQGRDVFAIPGSIHNPVARGCHKLIRQGAKLVEDVRDVLAELKISLQSQPHAVAATPSAQARALDKEYEMLLDAVGFEPASIDALVERTGLPSDSIASMLLILELDGRVAPYTGGRYCRLPEHSKP
jgi:DNA processing protein